MYVGGVSNENQNIKNIWLTFRKHIIYIEITYNTKQ